MNKIILTIALTAVAIVATAQIQYVNLTALTTNQTSSTAFITIPGVCTNAPYTATNPVSIVVGDPLSAAFGKVNSSFAYVSNELVLLLQMPYWYNTNLAAQVAILNGGIFTQSNRINSVVSTNTLLAGFIESFNGANIQSSTVNSNAFNTDTLAWLQTLLPSGGEMNFDGGYITSDGAGDIIGVGGSMSQFSDVSFDNEAIRSDGSGDWVVGGFGSFNSGGIILTNDSFGQGGTTIMLKDEVTGSPSYLHVVSGVLVVSPTP